ncbi:MAG TPA: CoA-binding protein, partial [Xanthobacteraceae bacterium]
MSAEEGARGAPAVARFLRPRSVAIIGISTRAGSAGQIILQCLKGNDFAGDVHLVGRTDEPIDGRQVLKSVDELPQGVDLAVFTLPAASVRDAMEACARRKVGAAMVFAAGFAETGDHATQDAVATTARAAGLAIVGPNCLGVTNNVDGLWLHMLYARKALRGVADGVAFVGQSGGLLGHFQRAADGRGIPLSYVISTGNEAGLETTDFLEFLVDDRATRVIVAYCEEIRRPQAFLAALRRARAAGKPVVLMLAGRSARARKSAQSHTGALVGDFATVRTQVEDAGAIVVSTMDEIMDLIAILQRFPVPPTKGPGILTASGAYVGLTNDFAEEIGLDLPELEPATLQKIRATLPPYGNYGNPLDTTAGFVPTMLPAVTKALIDDPNVGTLFISFPINTGIPVKAFNEGMAHSEKPKVMVALGDTLPLADDVHAAVKDSPAVFSRSSDRMLRAIALYTRYGRLLARPRAAPAHAPVSGLPRLGQGPQPEWLGKQALAAAGIRVPEGALARTADEAAAVASKIGYPVALKA